jgi:hypothetical protein
MDKGRNADGGLHSPMRVRELLARLQEVDPDFVIAIDAASQSLLILNPRPGFCDPRETEEDECSCLTDQDQEFLRSLHIKD